MKLSDVLKLPKQPHSLSIIKDFLEQPLSHLDYQAAFSFYFDIAIELKLYDMVFNEGLKIYKEIQQQVDTQYFEKILKNIIEASLELDKLDDAKRFIEIRKQKLPILKQYLGSLDDIKYKKKLGIPYLEDVLKVLKDVVPDQVKVFCHEELFNLYRNDHQYEMALNSIYELYNYDLKTKYFNEELKLLISLKRYDEIIEKVLSELKIHKDNTLAAIFLLEAYFRKKDFHKASTLEAEFEDQIDKENDDLRIKAYELIIDLYHQMDNKPSLDLYQRKLKSLLKTIDKKPKKDDLKELEVVYIEKVTEKSSTHKNVSKNLNIAFDLIKFSHMIDEKLLLRDYLRIFFMHLDQYIISYEHIVYLENESPNLFHYKKERLYDKTIIKQLIEDSIVNETMMTGEDILEDVKTLKYQKNIVTQKDFTDDIKFVYSFPIGDLGVFVSHFDEEIKDPGIHYDLLKLISAIIYSHVVDEKKLSKLKKDNRYYQNALNAPIINYRELTESKSTYNDFACQLFNIEKHFHLELFLKDISYEHINLYKDTISRLLSKSGESFELLYKYQEKYILEKLYSLKVGDEIIVMSIFLDQTKEINKTKELNDKVVVDHETGLSNIYQFSNDIDELLKDKASLLLIELDQNLKHIYGTENISKFFKEFAQHTKKFFNDGNTYRYDYNQVLVVLPYNDIRSVTKSVKDYFRYLDIYQSKVLRYEKFNANMGILRYPVVTVDKNKEKLLRFVDIALEKAKRNKEEKYNFFIFKDYEDELFEQTVIDHLNLAIESKNLGLIFNQITDTKKNVVWQYESELALLDLSIDSKYLIQIAKKRNRLIDLERYHIKAVCEFLVELEKKTERLIKLTIPISKETFLDPTFNPYLLGLLKSYGIPNDFIRLKFDMELRANQYQTQIQELIDHSISLDTTSLDMALSYPFHAVHIDYKKETIKWNSYLKSIKELLLNFNIALVIRNVKTKDQKESLEKLGINYMEGSIYKDLPAPVLLNKIKETL